MITQYLFVQAYIVLWGIHDCEHRYYKNSNSSLFFFFISLSSLSYMEVLNELAGKIPIY